MSKSPIPGEKIPDSDYLKYYENFQKLLPGQKAELRRVADPDDLAFTPAFYRLFPGIPTTRQHRNIAFLLPWLSHKEGSPSFSAQLAKQHIAEARIFQVVRATDAATSLIQLRRLAMQIKPTVDWKAFGEMIWYWGRDTSSPAKQTFVKDYYLALYTPAK